MAGAIARRPVAIRFVDDRTIDKQSNNELMAIFGWKTIAMAEVYRREANRRRLALESTHKLVNDARISIVAPKRTKRPMKTTPNLWHGAVESKRAASAKVPEKSRLPNSPQTRFVLVFCTLSKPTPSRLSGPLQPRQHEHSLTLRHWVKRSKDISAVCLFVPTVGSSIAAAIVRVLQPRLSH